MTGRHYRGVARYYDERICLSVCVSVCEHISGTTCPIFTNFAHVIPTDVVRSFSSGVAIRHVLPVL